MQFGNSHRVLEDAFLRVRLHQQLEGHAGHRALEALELGCIDACVGEEDSQLRLDLRAIYLRINAKDLRAGLGYDGGREGQLERAGLLRLQSRHRGAGEAAGYLGSSVGGVYRRPTRCSSRKRVMCPEGVGDCVARSLAAANDASAQALLLGLQAGGSAPLSWCRIQSVRAATSPCLRRAAAARRQLRASLVGRCCCCKPTARSLSGACDRRAARDA